ncbi:MAG: N-6 DNA methylase [candidate division Zixibacteria bacterium]|nr:N-6 DNA methylase [candidate division Zixibacteria bacterium]
MTLTVQSAIAAFGAAAKAKLASGAAAGQPEDQLRTPFESLLKDMAELCGIPRAKVVAVGESALGDIKTRPDYAVTVGGALVGFVELKAPGKGADPRRFSDAHDKAQWDRLRSLPNLIYTDGNAFSLWQNGELNGSVLALVGDIESSGKKLQPPPGLANLFESFLRWEPIPPRNAKDLAHISARLCRLLRDEVAEQLALGSEALTRLATDWRKLLFPDATDERFADGYAQAITFGLLMARAKGISLKTGLQQVAGELNTSSTLIGEALRLLTYDAENQKSLRTSLLTLTRVLDAVDWSKINKRDNREAAGHGEHTKAETWLYFYEDFLEVYDKDLRKQTGSYYTPPQVVAAMVGLVDEVLRTPRFALHAGLASPAVILADPATGTGTFLLGVLQKIAQTVEADEGEGAVKSAIQAAVKRLIAFEMQLGPFAVAQLRILAEIVDLAGSPPETPVRMFVTNTLGNPDDEEEWIPGMLGEIAKSRKEANKIKRNQPITVVLGNPPYKEKAKGLGGWIEGVDNTPDQVAPLEMWMPPADWGVGAHAKHLRNLYVYFWRWATWKVFDHHPANNTGIVCFITVAGFLNGPGFQKMRDYLRRTCDDIWVIDCSPEGHQPEVNTRIFQDVQQPICIVLASRSPRSRDDAPAHVRFQALPRGHRLAKFKALQAIRLKNSEWTDCPTDWRAPFLPASTGAWSTYPKLEDLFVYNGSGVMPGRTWIIAPDAESLEHRWDKLVHAGDDEKEVLFHPHESKGKLGDRHSRRVVKDGLPGYRANPKPVADERGAVLPPVRYGFRSFDRQWIIPDNRVINRPNPELWAVRSDRQVYLTALSRTSPLNGPALTVTGHLPDLDHYKGSFGGRIFPLWADGEGIASNIRSALLSFLSQRLGRAVTAEDMVPYIVAVAAHPAFTSRFQEDMSTPGLRIPITADRDTFNQAAELGRKIIWLHTFGERMADPENGRPASPPRLPRERMPHVPKEGAIPQTAADMPDSINYDVNRNRLLVGKGYVENVDPRVWNYEVSGKQVLVQWFSYRKANRDRPIIGDRRPPSPLCDIQPDCWLAEYTTELINVLNVLGLLVEAEPAQAGLLEKICAGPTISAGDLLAGGALAVPAKAKRGVREPAHPTLPGTV